MPGKGGHPPSQKTIEWMGSSKKDLMAMPLEVKRSIGFALRAAQAGEKHPDAKPLKGFKGAGCVAIHEDFQSDTYRAIYATVIREKIYVLHCFKKKSKSGISTPQHDIELIRDRLKQAQEHAKTNHPPILKRIPS